MNIYPTFRDAIEAIERRMCAQAHSVHSEKWQSIDISKRPEAEMRELLNVVFQVPIHSENLDGLQKQILPNLPWADEHFLERVSGSPVNPPPSAQRWPFIQNSSSTSFQKSSPLEIDERDWAYLAAMIDGDGSITFHQRNSPESTHRPRISIGQKDREFVLHLGRKFPFGRVSERSRRIRHLFNDKIYEADSSIWFVSRKADVEYVLKKILPYLFLKREKAVKALELLTERPPHHADRGLSPQAQTEEKYSHSYPERFWPKLAANSSTPRWGIRYPYGDLGDVVKLLAREPLTRQAYLNIWNHEDTGVVHGERVPCSLGYHFLNRGGHLHVFYPIRSCDLIRHFRDDLYLTVRLLLWVLSQAREINREAWGPVKPGIFTIWIGSLHCFINDYRTLQKKWSRLS